MSNWQSFGNTDGRRSGTVGVPIRVARISRVSGLVVFVLLAAALIGRDTTAVAQCNPQRLQRQMPNAETLKTRGNVGELPTWYTEVNITADEVQQICSKGLKAAFLNWSSGAYNQAVLNGVVLQLWNRRQLGAIIA